MTFTNSSRRRLRSLIAGVGLSLAASTMVGVPAAHAATIDVQILATNDFHGRLSPDRGGVAGAAVMTGAVKQLDADYPGHSDFVAAGDLIGASTFDSFIDKDKPTIDALNEAGLDVSAAGNHEFDQGYDDLVNRVMAPYDADSNPQGGAAWEYLAANVRNKSDGSHALPDRWIQDMGDVQVGYVGAVTEHLPELVSPAGISTLDVTNIVTEVNASADALKAEGADIVVLLMHEGAATTDYASAVDPTSDFGKVVNGVDADIDAIVSGHTHLAYNHAVPVDEWQAEGRAVTLRPVVSAGQYGSNLNKLVFSYDSATGRASAVAQEILPLETTPAYPADANTQAIVDDAIANAEVLGAVELGQLQGGFYRGQSLDGSENRGAESTLGNMVAEVQRWATEPANRGGAQIAFMNPGGLRADMLGNNTGGYPAALTYRQAATVQPFANTLVNMRLTGAQIAALLEEQWQPDGAQRPFLRLGVSKGFKYTYDAARPAGSRIKTMWLDGEKLEVTASYSVTANSFLATGGDNFTTFLAGTEQRDTGQIDLAAMVDYLDAFARNAPLSLDDKQRAIGVRFPADAPATYPLNSKLALSLTSWSMSAPTDRRDEQVSVSMGSRLLGTFSVDNTLDNDKFDETGKVAIDVTVPARLRGSEQTLTIEGLTTGTTLNVPITVYIPVDPPVAGGKARVALWADASPDRVRVDKTRPRIKVRLSSPDLDRVWGKVQVKAAGRTYVTKVTNGKAWLRLEPFSQVGRKRVSVKYLGNSRTREAYRAVYVQVRR